MRRAFCFLPGRGILLMLFLMLASAGILLLSTAVPARAQGPYIGVQGGWVWVEEAENRDDLGQFNLSFDAGTTGAVTLGYDLGERFPNIGKGRLELEGGYRNVDLNKADFADGKVKADGKLKVRSILLNSFAEYRDSDPWRPYVGFGLGYATIDLADATISGTPLADDKAQVFAWQFGAGVGLVLGDHLTVDFGYRYFGTTDPKFKMADGTKMKSEYASHAALLGLRLTY